MHYEHDLQHDLDIFRRIVAPHRSGRRDECAGLHRRRRPCRFSKDPGRADLALVVADRPVAAAGVFTTNRFCAAPVQVSREQLGGIEHGYGTMRAVVINSGNANAATGEPGLAIARETCGVVADA